MDLFNRTLLKRHAASLMVNRPTHPLLEKACATLVERLKWRSSTFHQVLILGPYNYILFDYIEKKYPDFLPKHTIIQYKNTQFDSEYLPFGENTFDCILSFFDVQTINDVPGHLKQLQYCLRKNGLFTGVFVGGDSFFEIQKLFFEIEEKYTNKTSLRFHPTISISDIAHLLQRAGFHSPISDIDHVVEEFSSWDHFYKTLSDLKAGYALNEKGATLLKKTYKELLDYNFSCCSIDHIYMTGLGV